jgi:hypothetical protein
MVLMKYKEISPHHNLEMTYCLGPIWPDFPCQGNCRASQRLLYLPRFCLGLEVKSVISLVSLT